MRSCPSPCNPMRAFRPSPCSRRLCSGNELMKSSLIFLLSLLTLGCNRAAPVATNVNSNGPAQTERSQTVLSHSGEGQTPKPANSGSGKWSQSGDPIDTEKFDDVIAKAERSLKQGGDEKAKVTLAEAYFDRGFALTEARQYASALGDYRRALKLNPEHEEAKKWLDQIVSIYTMLKKEPPKEGEEPPPLPYKKTA
jgi:Tetratricopeptide repeat